ncbi:succinate CoA transferase [Candidatus Azobacteroides pseudotrichonymphae]|uniref:Acetyl-CoA hydrolase/transferase n=1 Tax=Azobacteroides pseudotrichonymphae genomovar. CFP2 TaxID=511995 RepID=B6YR77_AZOPC|nr:succinate CoA transferase [Candidatus Azobacteroides pseudotrichonymphae]BAG83699.1 putative acetyl-CoA hydrolase/transferase [Candidatus Azobacteroides pseudotrichonymphae genomovar. CFP2]
MFYRKITAEEAASLIKNDDVISLSGFTATGCPKAITRALAARAEVEHVRGNPLKVGLCTGASTGESVDGVLSRVNAIKFRTPYQSNVDSRKALNDHDIHYFDLHISELAQYLRYGFLPKPDYAILEVCDITESGKIVLTSAVGVAPTIAHLADKIIIEFNRYHPRELVGMHDIYEPIDPPYRKEIPIYSVSDRIGVPYVQIDPRKVMGIVETDLPNEICSFTPLDKLTEQIGKNTADFLHGEIKIGRIPLSFLPIQSGVGNVANAVLEAMALNKEIPAFEIYTEVIQDAVIGLMKKGRVKFASGCSLSLTTPVLNEVYAELSFFKQKFLLRPQEISNNPEIIRRLGLISINTALEADIFGNINSTHIAGTRMMNGIGGSGDFCRNAYLSIFTTPSTAKGGKISSIVPMVSHVDHSEHSVKVLITEHGVADLRGLSPIQRAETIISNCVDDQYKDVLWRYLKLGQRGHTPQNIDVALSFHDAFNKTGDMRNVQW